MSFQATESDDRAFEVVCAALLVQRLCETRDRDVQVSDVASSESQDPPTGRATARFRYGLDLTVDEAPKGAGALDEKPPAQAVAVLASLARDGELVLGDAAYAAVDRPERLLLRAFSNPAVQALSTAATPCGIVTGADPAVEAMLARQAQLISLRDREPDA